MFEDSLMESQNRLSSPDQRWTTVLSLTFQCTVAAAIIALPLLYPEALPFRVDAPKVTLPLNSVPPPVPRVEPTNAPSTSASASNVARPVIELTHIPQLVQSSSDMPPITNLPDAGMGDQSGIASTLANAAPGTGPHVNVVPAKSASKGILKVSTGVSAGLLLAPITPVYPRIAATARIEGTVKVEAIISKSGHIESAHVVSGPEMLRQAALDAIRNARYTPYLLNDLPTEIETTITVNFKLSS